MLDRTLNGFNKFLLGGSGIDLDAQHALEKFTGLEGDMSSLFPADNPASLELLDRALKQYREHHENKQFSSATNLQQHLTKILGGIGVPVPDGAVLADLFLFGLQRALQRSLAEVATHLNDTADHANVQNAIALTVKAIRQLLPHEATFSGRETINAFDAGEGSPGHSAGQLFREPLRQQALALIIAGAVEKQIALRLPRSHRDFYRSGIGQALGQAMQLPASLGYVRAYAQGQDLPQARQARQTYRTPPPDATAWWKKAALLALMFSPARAGVARAAGNSIDPAIRRPLMARGASDKLAVQPEPAAAASQGSQLPALATDSIAAVAVASNDLSPPNADTYASDFAHRFLLNNGIGGALVRPENYLFEWSLPSIEVENIGARNNDIAARSNSVSLAQAVLKNADWKLLWQTQMNDIDRVWIRDIVTGKKYPAGPFAAATWSASRLPEIVQAITAFYAQHATRFANNLHRNFEADISRSQSHTADPGAHELPLSNADIAVLRASFYGDAPAPAGAGLLTINSVHGGLANGQPLLQSRTATDILVFRLPSAGGTTRIKGDPVALYIPLDEIPVRKFPSVERMHHYLRDRIVSEEGHPAAQPDGGGTRLARISDHFTIKDKATGIFKGKNGKPVSIRVGQRPQSSFAGPPEFFLKENPLPAGQDIADVLMQNYRGSAISNAEKSVETNSDYYRGTVSQGMRQLGPTALILGITMPQLGLALGLASAGANSYLLATARNPDEVQEAAIALAMDILFEGGSAANAMMRGGRQLQRLAANIRRLSPQQRWQLVKYAAPAMLNGERSLFQAGKASSAHAYQLPQKYLARMMRGTDTHGKPRGPENFSAISQDMADAIQNPKDLAHVKKLDLATDAYQYYVKARFPSRPELPELASTGSEKEILSQLIDHYPGIVIGERHGDATASLLLIKNMDVFREKKITVAFLENYTSELHQPSLDKYVEDMARWQIAGAKAGSEPGLPAPLASVTDALDRKIKSATLAGTSTTQPNRELLRSLAMNGIRPVALECLLCHADKVLLKPFQFNPSLPGNTVPYALNERLQNFNYFSSQIIDQTPRNGGKWIALTGGAHTGSVKMTGDTKSIPGIPEMTGAAGLRISSDQAGTGTQNRYTLTKRPGPIEISQSSREQLTVDFSLQIP